MEAAILFHIRSLRESMCIWDLLNQRRTPPPPSPSLLLLETFPGRGEKVSTDKRSLSGSQREGGLSFRWRFDMAAWAACCGCSLLPSPPPDARLTLSPRSPCPWAHSWRPPLLHALMRKMKEVQAGRIPSPPPPPSTTPFTLLLVPFVQPCLALTGPPALTHPRLSAGVGGTFYCTKLGIGS